MKKDSSPLTFSSSAYYLYGYYTGTMPEGTLSLRKNGRIEFVLDSGTKLFSAPVSLTKFTFDPVSTLKLVIGTQRYALVPFPGTSKKPTGSNDPDAAAESGQSSEFLKEWSDHLNQAKLLPADDQPLLAVKDNKQLRSIKSYSLFSIIATIFGSLLAVIVIILIFNLDFMKDASTGNQQVFSGILLIFVAIMIVAGLIIQDRAKKKRFKKIALQQNEADPSAILPPKTMATGSLGLSTAQTLYIVFGIMIVGVAVLLGLIEVFGS